MAAAAAPAPPQLEDQPTKVKMPISTPTNVDNYFDLDSFIKDENQRDRERWTVAREAEERREQEELEADKAETLRLAKEEKKRCNAKMWTKCLNEQASTSIETSIALLTKIAQPAKMDQPPLVPHKEIVNTNANEEAQPKDEDPIIEHKEVKAPMDNENNK